MFLFQLFNFILFQVFHIILTLYYCLFIYLFFQATRTPTRDAAGIALLLRYYNQLYFIERRFFPPDRSLGIHFEWFDSLTGVPSRQRTVAFEKASILFNAGALYTQLAAKQDRHSTRGLDQAVDAFLRAAGTFRYIHENFTNAPSMDLGPDMLEMLVQLMLVGLLYVSLDDLMSRMRARTCKILITIKH